MTRQELWEAIKKHSITHSKRPDCPSDADLKIVITCTQASAKQLVDFLCSLDWFTKKPKLNSSGTMLD